DRSVATTLGQGATFLYTGANAIQTGLTATIDPARIAVLRGMVRTHDGEPLPGVRITILGHDDPAVPAASFGATVTQANGMFDMAVNGGGTLTVAYAMAGRLPVQRQIEVAARDYAWLPDVVMIEPDAATTTIL